MQFSVLAVSVAVASFIGSATANNCDKGLNYCGRTLLSTGNYWQDIKDELARHGQFGAEMNALFNCGNNGEIHYIQMCGNCIYKQGSNDYCG